MPSSSSAGSKKGYGGLQCSSKRPVKGSQGEEERQACVVLLAIRHSVACLAATYTTIIIVECTM